MNTCIICSGLLEDKVYTVREMQFGTKEEFVYRQCTKCNCLQINEVPENISEYYPESYPSFQSRALNQPSIGYFKEKIRLFRTKFYLNEKLSLLHRMSSLFFEKPIHIEWMQELGHLVDYKSSILDVGCGTGKLLYNLSYLGYKNLNGVDPFILNDIFNSRFRIKKNSVFQVKHDFDLIMFNHSLEHVPDPAAIFTHLSKIMKSGSYLLVRIPVIDSSAWEEYKENWVQIDAPRHIFIPSKKSMQVLAKLGDFTLIKTIYDSDELQYMGSEQYKLDIPLQSEKSFSINIKNSLFSKEERLGYQKKAKYLNTKGRGDQACFFFIKN
ncbi:class I SAM-dependent methyltransferase [Altericista sp. CCNU0014]|uniref:class I SAM-dependent methyltransferase n=1 Tax=Altericista sp. CCNU0014 TaxID=3082949 RepID=UPI00384A9FDC